MYQWGLLHFLLNIDMDSAILLFCFLLSSFTHFHFSLIFLLFAPSPFISVSWLSITCSLMVWFVVTESSVTKEAKWNGSESGTVLSVMNYAGGGGGRGQVGGRCFGYTPRHKQGPQVVHSSVLLFLTIWSQWTGTPSYTHSHLPCTLVCLKTIS